MKRNRRRMLALPAFAFGLFVMPTSAQPRPGNPEAANEIQKNAEAFVEAFHNGKAKAVAARWIADGDYTDVTGQQHKGRDAIEKLFTGQFAENKGLKVRIEGLALRFVSPDVAVEDGTSEVFPADGGPPSRVRFVVVHVRKDGQWLFSSVRNSPFQPPSNLRSPPRAGLGRSAIGPAVAPAARWNG